MVSVDDEVGRQGRPFQDQSRREEEEHRPGFLDGDRHVDDGRTGEGVAPRGARPHLKPDARASGDHGGDPDSNTNDDAQLEHSNHANDEPDYADDEPDPGQSHGRGAALSQVGRLIRFISTIPSF